MVYEIKYDPKQGRRRIIVKNGAQNQPSAMITEIIDALKGLTFKIEVKITDIVTSTAPIMPPAPISTPLPMLAASVSPIAPTIASVTPRVPTSTPVAASASTYVPASAPTFLPAPTLTATAPMAARTTARVSAPAPMPQPTVSVAAPVMPAPSLMTVPVPAPTPAPAPVPVSVPAPVSAPAPVTEPTLELPGVVKGSIMVGSTVETCCIALDSCMNPPTAYISYDETKLIQVAEVLRELDREIEKLAEPTSLSAGCIVYAKSAEDDQWYRAIVESAHGDNMEVFFFDWGLRETLTKKRIRNLIHTELGLSKFPACALKLHFTGESQLLLDEVLKCESAFKMRVDSFNELTDSYTVTVIGKCSR